MITSSLTFYHRFTIVFMGTTETTSMIVVTKVKTVTDESLVVDTIVCA